MRKFIGLTAVVLLLSPVLLLAGETGKIAGRVVDGSTNEPIVGANVVVQGTYLGAATNIDGFYTINNIPPGRYSVTVSFMGYRKHTTTDVIVKIDLTTRVDAKLQSEAIEADEIIVRAERPMVQKDLTSSSVTVSSEDLKRIPTENIGQVVNIQAGVVAGHFRGGRANEVAYLIDGVSVTDPFNNQLSMQIDNSSVREMEVISGTFNAEYGKVMSGVVNVVTPEGSPKFHGSISGYLGDYATSHSDTYTNLGKFPNPFPNVNGGQAHGSKNFQGTLSGPLYFDGLSFFLTGRYYRDEGYLWGTRVYNITDRAPIALTYPDGSPIQDQNGNQVYDLNTNNGDGASVPMNPYQRRSFNGKVTYAVPLFKFSYSVFWDQNWNKYYDHAWSWAPDGMMNHYRTNWVNSFQVTHAPSANTYQTLKVSYNDFDYEGYLWGNPYDPRYVDPSQGTPLSGYTFQQGGNQADRYDRYSHGWIAQWSLTSQVSPNHKVATGIEARFHDIYNHNMSMINKNTTVTDSITHALVFEIGYPQPGAPGNQSYRKYPIEFSGYVQDKMEFDMMIINAGVRFDYFDPKSSYPVDLRNPGYPGNPLFPGAGQTQAAKPKVQVSPRLGISFPITDKGIIHFSYGHFFQIPDFQYLYYNSDYLVTASSGLSNIIGNPDLEAERRVMYEVGLQQVLFNNIGVNFTVYYSDIRNLLGQEIINTYEGFKYARFINRDYANVRGIILSVDRRFTDYFGLKVDYTYQIAEGNASDPMAVYNNNQTDPPIETNKKVVPLDWDQRSTLNASLTFGQPGDWNVGLIASYGSGTPYTEDIRVSQGIRFENGGRKPPSFNTDLRAEKSFRFGELNLTLFTIVYNLFDTMNEYGVNSSSGRANVDLYTYLAGPIIGWNTIDQYVNNPASFSAPRQVQVGLTVDF